MNLIVNRHLDGAQKQVIYELTLKKRQSKKSTMSEKQVAARQQLAIELMQERKDPINTPFFSNNYPLGSSIESHNNYNDSHNYNPVDCSPEGAAAPETTTAIIDDQHSLDELPSTSSTTTDRISANITNSLSNIHISTDGSTGSCRSFSRSDSSYSASSLDSGSPAVTSNHPHLNLQPQRQLDELGKRHAEELQLRKKEASIKFNKTRLEHLNCLLERRLHQYEYLVAQEKALLGTYNMMLFTKQGVNNFHLYDAQANLARRAHLGNQRSASFHELQSTSSNPCRDCNQ